MENISVSKMSSSDDSDRAYLTDENNSVMSDQSEDVTGQSCMMFDDDDSIDPSDPQLADAPDKSVLMRLDLLLREKINLEVEDFQSNLHQILDGQIHLIQNLLKLSQKNKSNYQSDFNSTKDLSLGTDSFPVDQNAELEVSSPGFDEKDRLLVELFTSASIISTTLRRPEFSM